VPIALRRSPFQGRIERDIDVERRIIRATARSRICREVQGFVEMFKTQLKTQSVHVTYVLEHWIRREQIVREMVVVVVPHEAGIGHSGLS
jgi:hypothetical protein